MKFLQFFSKTLVFCGKRNFLKITTIFPDYFTIDLAKESGMSGDMDNFHWKFQWKISDPLFW